MFEIESTLTVDFFLRFLVNGFSLFALLRLIHYRSSSQSDSLGGFLLLSNGIFIVTALLHNIEMSMGFAFGLFAVFSMLRYRTESMSVLDMAYLFVSIAISLMSAVSNLNIFELIFINSVICVSAIFCESSFLVTRLLEKNIVYENIELIRPERRDELLSDLEKRTGLTIERIEIGDVNFLRDIVNLKIYHLTTKVPAKSNQIVTSNNNEYSSIDVKNGQ